LALLFSAFGCIFQCV